MDWYRAVLRPVLFRSRLEPEFLHNRSMALLHWAEQTQPTAVFPWLKTFTCPDHRLAQTLWGLEFSNPIGLAAGFDKDGLAPTMWPRLGFGYAELGTVTAQPQPGNPQPRLFRLERDRAILNRMGFNNAGSAALAERLRHLKAKPIAPIGINLGKSKITPLTAAPQDYQLSFERLRDLGDYFVVNVSSPNTPGLRELQDRDQLSQILDAIQSVNPHHKPLLVKIAPDLSTDAIAAVVQLAQDYQLAGIIATNTTIRRDGLQTQILNRTGNAITAEAGGISGAPLRARSTAVIRQIWQQTQGNLPIIGVGGIFTAMDVWEKITAGASLVQLYTSWIYQGPSLLKALNTGLIEQLDRAGLNSIQDAIGLAQR